MIGNYKLLIKYNGTSFHGWQRQKNERTVQGDLEKAIMTMTRQKITLTGSGRTDAGVHAIGQVANFLCRTKISPDAFKRGINSLVHDDIVINECTKVDEKFHSRFDAKSKIYKYWILNRLTPSAIFRNYSWFISKQLDINAMSHAAEYLYGTHDFKAFEGTGSPRANSIRTILNASFKKKGRGYLAFDIEANGFLRYMVRNIVSTLADVGLGKITPEDLKKILLSKDRSIAGATAPGKGLFLMKVIY